METLNKKLNEEVFKIKRESKYIEYYKRDFEYSFDFKNKEKDLIYAVINEEQNKKVYELCRNVKWDEKDTYLIITNDGVYDVHIAFGFDNLDGTHEIAFQVLEDNIIWEKIVQ